MKKKQKEKFWSKRQLLVCYLQCGWSTSRQQSLKDRDYDRQNLFLSKVKTNESKYWPTL